MTILLGLIGKKGAGKDTLANVLVTQHGFKRVAFADALYKEVADLLGVSVEELQNRERKEKKQSHITWLAILKRLENKPEIYMHVQGFLKTLGYEHVTQPMSYRDVLQFWGTEYKRHYCNDDLHWVNKVRDVVTQYRLAGYSVVITDVRFLNETNYLENNEGVTCRVLNSFIEDNANSAHISEQQLLDYPTTYQVDNVKDNYRPLEIFSQVVIDEETRKNRRSSTF